VACANSDGFYLWDGRQRPDTWQPAKGNPTMRATAFAPDGRLWAAEGADVVARSVPERGKITARWSSAPIRVVTGSAYPISLAAGGQWVVAGGVNGHVYVLRAADAAREAAAKVAATPIRSIALDPAGAQAVAGSDGGEVCLLSLPTGQTVARAVAHRDRVTAVAFSGHDLIASGARDRSIKLWRAERDKLVELFSLRTPAPVRSLAFHPDGRQLFVLQEHDGAVRIWNLDRLWQTFGELGVGIEPALSRPDAPRPAPAPPVFKPPLVVAPTGPHGLKAEVFHDMELRKLVRVLYDPNINFSWGEERFYSTLPRDHMSIRWTGWLKAPTPGDYSLRLKVDEGARLWLDRKLLIDCWTPEASDHEVRVSLTDRPHELRLEYFELTASAHCRLLWAQEGGFSMRPIPTDALFHDRLAAEKVAR
jgi:hypothetical protein